jgi:hypothetical protein
MRRLAAVIVLALAMIAVPASAGAEVDFVRLREKASRFAERTYINAPTYGSHRRTHKRRFHLFEQLSYKVKATDGSLLSGFQATLASADGTGDIVLLFDEERFVGWASNRLAANLTLARRGNAILVRYAVYRHRDAICCPSGFKAITYKWNGSKIVRGGMPPPAYGEFGPRLHLGG